MGKTRDLWKSIKKDYDIDKNKLYKGFDFGPTLDKWETADADYVHEWNEINALADLAQKMQIKDAAKYAGKIKLIEKKLAKMQVKQNLIGMKCNKLLDLLIDKANKIQKIAKTKGPAGLENDIKLVWVSLGKLSKSRYNSDFVIWEDPNDIAYVKKQVESAVKVIMRSPV